MPRSLLRACGRAAGAIACFALRRERRIADENVLRAFPELDRNARHRLVQDAYTSLGDDIGTAAHAMTSGRFEPLELSDTDTCMLHSLMEEGRGVLFVSAHLGPWEQVAASVVAHGFPLVTIARESYDPRLTAIYDRLRGRHGVRSIYRGAPGAALRAMRVLRSGGLLGVVMDLNSRVPSIDAPFLGILARTAIGPARLALRASARVVVATAAPTVASSNLEPSRRIRMTFSPIDTSDLAPGTDGERALTERINDELSRRIRALPTRWVWMHPRWTSVVGRTGK